MCDGWWDEPTVTAMSVMLAGHGEEYVEQQVKGKEGVTHIQFCAQWLY